MYTKVVTSCLQLCAFVRCYSHPHTLRAQFLREKATHVRKSLGLSQVDDGVRKRADRKQSFVCVHSMHLRLPHIRRSSRFSSTTCSTVPARCMFAFRSPHFACGVLSAGGNPAQDQCCKIHREGEESIVVVMAVWKRVTHFILRRLMIGMVDGTG